MNTFTLENITDVAVGRLGTDAAPRVKEIMIHLIRHVHAFVLEVGLTPEEWFDGIQFLTACGQACTDKRQEFILLSDTLAVSTVVDLIAHASHPESATASTLLGPFYREGAPEMVNGQSIAEFTLGDPVIVRGRVTNTGGQPIAGATVETWHSDPGGFYDVQREVDRMELRGVFHTDEKGRFEFRTVKAHSYPIPTDGPVGKLLRISGQHPFRPPHYHFKISAPGYERLVTALYIAGEEYLDSDAVFGVRQSLIIAYKRDPALPNVDVVEYDFALADAARS
jgi:hydroxyquinol 1,2-dioxygenase